MTQKVSNLLREYFEVSDREFDRALGSLGRKTPVVAVRAFDWEVHRDPERFSKRFKLDSRDRTISFVNEILAFEDEFKHHGEIRISHTEVDVSVYTHDVNRITNLDKEYVAEVDKIYRDVLDFDY